MNETKTIVFAPIAERETLFYLALAKKIRDQNPKTCIHFVSFYQPTNSLILKSGFYLHDVYSEQLDSDEMKTDAEVFRDFGIESLASLTFHEKITFDITNRTILVNKFKRYLYACDRILSQVSGSAKSISVFQELGGFIAPLSLFYASQRQGASHFFFEPSFFRGRVYFVKNSLNAPRVPREGVTNEDTEPLVQKYLNDVLSKRSAVIPSKDAHHFKDMGLKKIFNFPNLRKLSKKLLYKFVLNKKQEYEHVFNHTRRSLSMLFNRWACADLYSNRSHSLSSEKFAYFPFHVRLDYALTTRSPQYFDQIGLALKIAAALPDGYRLYVKEHPASIGSFNRGELQHLLSESRIRVLHPTVSTYDILQHADAIVTINSKVGAEAISLSKDVYVFGESFYSGSKLVNYVGSIDELRGLLNDRLYLKKPALKVDADRINFFTAIWDSTLPGELYDLDPANVSKFSDQILGSI